MESSKTSGYSMVARILIESEGDDDDPSVVVGRSSVDSEVLHQPLVVTMGVDGSPSVPKPYFRDMVVGQNEAGEGSLRLKDPVTTRPSSLTVTPLAEGGSNDTETVDSSRSQPIAVEHVAQDSIPMVGIQVQNVTHPSVNDKLLENVNPRVNRKGVAETMRTDVDLHGSEKSSVITAKDTIITAPTSFQADKHTTIRVVEEGANRNVNPSVGIPQKNGKLKKEEVNNQKPVEVSKWIKNVTIELSTGSFVEHGEIRNNEPDCHARSNIQWIENSTYEGEWNAVVQ
ncbi:hypothetical protein V6N13_106994 [Hibiscus sabdariffa]|uniref:Uncharacterized protein n=1 Tax=Hibiscus sabdariffa TaxID=183260 RepID=A0ABR2F2E5_9ROSI